jgi:hypothetical protein
VNAHQTDRPTRLVFGKENNAIHVIFSDLLRDGSIRNSPEDPGLPVITLFGPSAIIKLRSQASDIKATLPTFSAYMKLLYGGSFESQDLVHNPGWALIGSLGNNLEQGVIPPEFRLATPPTIRAHNYDKVPDRFLRYYDQGKCLAATITIEEGQQQDRGHAVDLVQNQHRCLLI